MLFSTKDLLMECKSNFRQPKKYVRSPTKVSLQENEDEGTSEGLEQE